MVYFALDVDIQGQLFPNIYTLITQLGATFIIFVVFKKFLYIPVVNWLDQRAEKMQEDLVIAQQQKQLAFEEVEKAKQLYQDNVVAGRNLISESQNQAQQEKQAILHAAKVEADAMLAQAKIAIENQRQELLVNINDEIVDVAMAATNKLLHQSISEDTLQQAIDEFVKELRS